MSREDSEYDTCYRLAVEVSLKAGEMIKEGFYKEKRVEEKLSRLDLVTETDKAVELMVVHTLRDNYPDHCIIGEEGVSSTGQTMSLTDKPTWIIDPVDGTMNFVHKNPIVAISIGFWVQKEAVFGVIYNPITDKLYTARRRQGAYCNGRPMSVTKSTDLSRCLVAAEFGDASDSAKLDMKMENLRRIVRKSHGTRQLGSATGNMMAIAAGEVDAYYGFGMHCWDLAAAEIIVREAGGVVMDSEGGPLNIMNRRIVAACSEAVASEICSTIDTIAFPSDQQ